MLYQPGSPCSEHVNSPILMFNPGQHKTIKETGLHLKGQDKPPYHILAHIGGYIRSVIFFSLLVGEGEAYRAHSISLNTLESPKLERTNHAAGPPKITSPHHSHSTESATCRIVSLNAKPPPYDVSSGFSLFLKPPALSLSKPASNLHPHPSPQHTPVNL